MNSKRRTDFLSFFGGCGDLEVEVLGVGSTGGLVGIGVDPPGCLCLVGIGVVFCGAG